MRTYTDPGAFLERAQPFLESEEVVNGLVLGIALRLRERAERKDTPPYLATADTRVGAPALIAAMTPPHNILLAGAPELPSVLLDELIENLRAGGWPVPGVTAENRLAARFADAWTRQTGQPHRVRIRMRAYELRKVIYPPHPAAGYLRMAVLEDLETLFPWRLAFHQESLHEAAPENTREILIHQIEQGTLYGWDDHGLVSMANSTRPNRHGIWIGGVYTPSHLRGRGYASACVAAVTQQLLDSGKSYCALFTDLDYPISNSIYQKIGYQPVCDFYETQFSGD